MKVIKAIIWATVFTVATAGLGAGEAITLLVCVVGGTVGYVTEKWDQEDRRQRYIDQEAAKQERQARLIADAIAEREARQQLGEFTTS